MAVTDDGNGDKENIFQEVYLGTKPIAGGLTFSAQREWVEAVLRTSGVFRNHLLGLLNAFMKFSGVLIISFIKKKKKSPVQLLLKLFLLDALFHF